MASRTANRRYPYPEGTDPPAGHSQIKALAEALDSDVSGVDARINLLESVDWSNQTVKVGKLQVSGTAEFYSDVSMAKNLAVGGKLTVTNTVDAGCVTFDCVPPILGGSGPSTPDVGVNLAGLSKAMAGIPRLYQVTALLTPRTIAAASASPTSVVDHWLDEGDNWQLKDVPVKGFFGSDAGLVQVAIVQVSQVIISSKQGAAGTWKQVGPGGFNSWAYLRNTPGELDIGVKWVSEKTSLGGGISGLNDPVIEVVMTMITMPSGGYETSPAAKALPVPTYGVNTYALPTHSATVGEPPVEILHLTYENGNILRFG